MSLTELEIRASKAQPKPYKLYDERGLFLLMKPNGMLLWRFKYVYSGVESYSRSVRTPKFRSSARERSAMKRADCSPMP